VKVMQVKAALDALFEDIEFDTKLYQKLLVNNIEFITRTQEYTRLFSGRSIGCYFIKYTMFDKNIFYENLFDMQVEDVLDAVAKVKTIPSSFKIARDDVNLITFYMAHRFLSNDKLSEKQKSQYASEALNYFSYRTLVLISSMYFVYPISEAKAVSLTERLSNKYVIKNVKNWNEYCQYRSAEYLKGKFKPLLVKLDNYRDLPNAITDLFSRTKDTLKNIYGEFMVMLERDEVMASKTATITDNEGVDSIADRVDSIGKYIGAVDTLLVDKSSLIRKSHIAVVIDILPSLSAKVLEEALLHMLSYAYSGPEGYVKVNTFFKDILGNAVDYLQRNELSLNAKSDTTLLMNSLVGNVLYARGTNVSIHQLKAHLDKTVKQVYKSAKSPINERTVANVRNGLYLYIVLMAITH
jgi:hypothetical protein